MSTPAPSGGPSPLRVGGLALLGVGAVAAIVGIGTLVSGGGDGSGTAAAPPASASAAPTSGVPTSGVPPTGGVAVPSFGSTPTGAIAGPGAGTDGSGTAGAGGGTGSGTGSGSGGGTAGAGGSGASSGSGGSGGGATVVKSPVRVYNNSTITGLATRAADDFRNEGWPVDAVANYPQGTIPTSTVYYRPGTSEQSGAEAMGKAFGMRVEPRFVGLDDASPGLIAIVTNDYQKR